MSGDIKAEVPVNSSFGQAGLQPVSVSVPNPYKTPAAKEGLEEHETDRAVLRYPAPADVCPL